MDKELDNKAVGLRLRLQRVALGYSQEYVAEKCKMSSQQVSKIETGASGMNCETLVRIINFYNLSADYVLFGKETKSKNPFVILTEKLHESKKESLFQVMKLIIESWQKKED